VADTPKQSGLFVVATPARMVCDDNARALERAGLLRFIALGTRCGTAGGIPKLLDDGENGLLVEPGNVSELAAALERMISDNIFRARYITNVLQSILDKGKITEKMAE
jgi:glycosyltransferase involved in cell wall biosynthesis